MNRLPSGGLPELPPLPGQVDDALRMVHDRRRRSARRAASSACAVLVAALLATSRGPSTSMLEQTNEGVTQTATAVPSPTGHGRETDSATGPRLATQAPGVTLSPGERREPSPDATRRPRVREMVSPLPTASVRPRPLMTRERYSNLAPDKVGGRSGSSCGPGAGTYCAVAGNRMGLGDSVELSITVCAMSEPYELRFADEQEADAIVRDKAGRELWRWSLGQGFADEPHTISLAPEECVRWTVLWDYRDERGVRVPVSGDYYPVSLPVLSDPGHSMGTSVRVPPPPR